ncbi:type II toxin-antitoxin system HicB family antitoxin [Crocosphaera sp.]|uniref:type II toxin-antitoxin system HicB family antitoxin n=1 Tax=Crocosphaera sp. TaxID=2729996 RepID=UPI002614D254|nr:type II toxin-antitoxin system HicB family antitoxin [Crocosphaera sp.]MDJ0578825.1 type II toxin-antitoxin system HicB family antitoxin [Crocosphaera sp.]
MKGELTAIIEAAEEGGYWAICPEVPGANGQGETILPINNNTLNNLLSEISQECNNVNVLINQLQLSDITEKQKAQILAEILTATIHLQVHCDESFQDLIAEEMETLPDDDEID